jgi:amidase
MAVSDDELCYLSITEIGRRLETRTLTSADLTAAYLSRIAAQDGHLKSFARLTAGSALADADRADSERAAGQVRGPLHGVPVAIKDLIDSKGVVTAAGTALRAAHVPEEDATVLARLRVAGAVVLGKLALTEGATLCYHPSIAAPRNPWNTEHSSGFSSSGSAAAVAAGLCAAALGTDTGGSIRIPASYNGVTGLKPTWGRVSRHGIFPLTEFLDTVGPMARSAADVAAVLRIIAGADPHDPSAARQPVPDYLAAIEGGVSEIVIGVDWEAVDADCEPAVAAGLRTVAAVLANQGAHVRAVAMPPANLPSMMQLAIAGMADAHRATYPLHADDYGPEIRAFLEQGLATRGIDVAAAINVANIYRARLEALFLDVDLILAPATALVAPATGILEAEMANDPAALFQRMAHSVPFNITGSPTITFPTGLSDGLPTSAQLIAPHFSETLLLRAAHAFQSATDWHLRRPVLGRLME